MEKYLNTSKPVCILGNPNTGKTNLCIYLARKAPYEKRYLLGYPKKIDGFENLSDLRDISKICDCCLVIDEIDEIVPIYDKKSNESLRRLLKFTAHNNIKVIFNTQLSQFVSKMLCALVPCWAITEIDIFELKNGSKPKRILLDYIKMPQIVNREVGMRLDVGKFLWYNDQAGPGENGLYEFKDQNVDKAWKNSAQKPEKTGEQKVTKNNFPHKNPAKNCAAPSVMTHA